MNAKRVGRVGFECEAHRGVRRFRRNDLTVRLLSGGRSVGGSVISLEKQGYGCLMDFGLDFRRHGELYDSFLDVRSAHGILDAWQLGLIPRIGGLYRRDLMPIGRQLRAREIPVDDCLVTHMHLDHCGLLGALKQSIPIHCSATTAMGMLAMQIGGGGDFFAEMARCTPRQPSSSDPRALHAAPTSVPALARPLRVCNGEVSDELWRRWNGPASPSSRARQVLPSRVEVSDGKLGPFTYRAYEVAHSVPGCLGFVVEDDGFMGDDGFLVAYTGDLRCHGGRSQTTYDFISVLAERRPDILFVEGTRIGRPMDRIVTEDDVRDRMIDLVAAARGRPCVIDLGPRHVERLRSALQAAKDSGRHLVITLKDALLLDHLAAADTSLDVLADPAVLIHDKVAASHHGWEAPLRQIYGGRLVDTATLKSQLNDVVLSYSYFDCPEFVCLDPQRLAYIYSSSEAYGEDQRLNLYKLGNWVRAFGGEIHGFTWEGCGERGKPVFSGDLNSSGHIDELSLKNLLLEVKPHVVAPLHTQSPEWFEETLRGEKIDVVIDADSRGVTLTRCG